MATLVCPETQAPLRPATPAQLDALAKAAAAGELVDRKGAPVTGRVDGALIRADGEVAYLIQDGIVALVTHSGVTGPFGQAAS